MGKIISLVIVAVVLVGGFLYWNSQKKSSSESVAATQSVPEMMPEKGMISSIREAMGLGEKMQCTYSVKNGDVPVESSVVVDGGKYRSTSMVGGMTVQALFDGEYQYSWTSASKTGMKMSKDCLVKMASWAKETTEKLPTMPESRDMEKTFDMAEGVKCVPAPETDFTVPSDITFTDQCAMMEQSMEMMKEMKEKMPAGMTMPDMSKMMAQ